MDQGICMAKCESKASHPTKDSMEKTVMEQNKLTGGFQTLSVPEWREEFLDI